MQNITSKKFFLYARKSTDVEDKQVLSIEAQTTELRAFAKQENLNIIETFIEKQSAKIPGRPIFNEMIKRIERGEANGILAWHPFMLTPSYPRLQSPQILKHKTASLNVF
jgi:hypothetical protein